MNGPVITKTIKAKPRRPCAVCGGESNGVRCGVLSCSACAIFFRRAIRLNTKYVCQLNERCLESGGYQRCAFCRLKKCHAVGMNLVNKKSAVVARSTAILKGATVSPPPINKETEVISNTEQTKAMSLEEMVKHYKQQREIRRRVEIELFFPNQKPEEIKNVDSNEMLCTKRMEFLKLTHVAFLTNCFPEFREMNDEEKSIIFRSSFSMIVLCEVHFMSYHRLPPERHDIEYMMTEFSSLTRETIPFFWKEFRLKTSSKNVDFLVKTMQENIFCFREATRTMHAMKMMDEEYVALLCFCIWGCVYQGDTLSDKIKQSSSRIRKHVHNELQKLYKKNNITNYYERFNHFSTLLAYVDDAAHHMITHFTLMHIYDFSDGKSFLREYIEGPDFNADISTILQQYVK